MAEYKKYNAMEPILHEINNEFVALDKNEERRNNIILHEVINGLLAKMSIIDNLFDELFKKCFYGGSYYDGLKVGKPNEYDIDILLVLPKRVGAEMVISNKPGFVHTKLKYPGSLEQFCESRNNYLDTNKLLKWIQSLLQKVLNKYNNNLYELCGRNLNVTIRKAGPAFTLEITGTLEGKPCDMDVDLVTCIEFGNDKWPTGGYRTNPYDMTFFVVPKCPKGNIDYATRYWRLSFQAQERKLIAGKEKLKPALRLLKKMRDTLNQPIASYHLKTIVLWEVLDNPHNFSAEKSLSFVFMHILKLYKDKILAKNIPYFWNKKLNLIDNFHQSTYTNIGHYLENIIKDIDKDPTRIRKYICGISPENGIIDVQEEAGSCIIL